jgi:TRAP-type C4-dicarboxylate transport system permease small subunit
VRQALDSLFTASAWAAALALVGVLVAVLLSIIGRQVGFNIPGIDAYAGYSMAAAGFLALAHTLKCNEHIRVTLLIGRARGRARHYLELWALSAATLLAGLFAFYAGRLVWGSYEMHDISIGNDATPLWIPQSAMAIGTLVLFIAFVDGWLAHLLGRPRAVHSSEATHHE